MTNEREPALLKMTATAQFKQLVPCRKAKGSLAWAVEMGYT